MPASPKRRRIRTGRRDWLWAVAAAVAVLAAVAIAFVMLAGGSSSGAKAVVAGVDCESGERLNYHVHAHLDIFIEGQATEVPTNIGIRPDCLFWLHTHAPNGLLHVEAPEKCDFTLEQFFAVWGQPLSSTQLMDRTTDATHQVQATVNGETWSGNPADIPLTDKTTIVLEYGPPFVPPPSFDWGQ
ncbi:MAG TPA: hypothetical protein VLS25_06305, partial [Dehalococcoidia bacterium]|nr:hypothetical protein [Dehalococcoidia bacterium]